MVKQKKCIATIFEHIFLNLFFRASYEDVDLKKVITLGAETFASGKIRETFAFREHKLSRIGQNRIFRILNFREWTEKLIFFVVLRKRLDPDRNKREKKTLLFQAFVILGLVFEHQTFF